MRSISAWEQSQGPTTAADSSLTTDLFHANTLFVVAACVLLLWVSLQSYRQHRLAFLKLWVVAWCSYLAARLLTWLQLGPLIGLSSTWGGALLSITSQVGYYVHLAFLLIALMGLAQRWTWQPSRRMTTALVVGLTVFAAAITLSTWQPSAWRAGLRVGLRCSVTTVVLLWCGILLVLHGRRVQRLGARLTGVALLAGAVVFGSYAYAFSFGSLAPVLAYMGAAEVLFVCTLGLGLVLWTQEDLAGEAEFVSQELGKRNLDLARAQRVESVGQLAGGIAHDFHNVLTAVTGNLTFVLDRQDLDATVRGALVDANRAAEQAGKLTKRLLGMARDASTVPSRVDLNSEVSEMLPLLRSVVGRRIDIRVEQASGSLPVMLRGSQIDQVLLNLVSNARDAILADGVITIATRRVSANPGRRVLLSVSDNGCGMADEVRNRVGELFFTTKGGQGNGIGMAAVRGMVESADGGMEIDSAPHAGTTIRVWWPEAVTPPGGNVQTASPTKSSGRTILFTEDDVLTRHTMVKVLEDAGYVVIAPVDSEAAARVLASAQHLDLFVTDVVMPGFTGPELIRLARQSRPGLATRLISGSVFKVQEDVPLLPKPFTPQEFLAFVADALPPAVRTGAASELR